MRRPERIRERAGARPMSWGGGRLAWSGGRNVVEYEACFMCEERGYSASSTDRIRTGTAVEKEN